MGYLEHYTPIVRAIAYKLSYDPVLRDDLVQEGLIKVFQFSVKLPEPDIYSRDNQNLISKSISNTMTDYLRSGSHRNKTEDVHEEYAYLSEKMISPEDPVGLSVSKIKDHLEDVDRRVLDEIHQPSEKLNWFLRKRRFVYKQFQGLTEDWWGMYAMGEYFGLSEWEFRKSVERIKSAAHAVFKIK